MEVTELPESTYHYPLSQKNNAKQDDPMNNTVIQVIFREHNGNYGYRRIRDELRARGHLVNHKRVQRIMNKLDLHCTNFSRKSHRYTSYTGNIGHIATNKMNRRFTTPFPLRKLATDVTEFKRLDYEKLCLSPIVDFYNG